MYLHSYYLKNKERIAAKSSARYLRCKEKILQQHKERHKIYKDTIHGRYTRAKQFGQRHGKHTWTITYDQWLLLVDNPCYYCAGAVEKYGTGLDRIDSSIGYEFANVRPCCKYCNQAKNNLPERAFYILISQIYDNLQLGERLKAA